MFRIRAGMVPRKAADGATPARSGAVLLLLFAAVPLFAANAPVSALRGTPARSGSLSTARTWGQMPLYFVPNRGQAARSTDFYVPGRREQVYFDAHGLTFVLAGPATPPASVSQDPVEPGAPVHPQPSRRAAVRVGFLGARVAPPVGSADLGTRFHYLSGPRSRWKTGIPAFGRLTYRNLWPGIDLVFHGTTDRMKYEFVVRPGADPRQIRLAYTGAEEVRVDDDGRLVAETPLGSVMDAAPVSYQGAGGEQAPVESRWQVRRTGSRAEVGVRVGVFDRRRTLVIDPATFLYCGYIGGSQSDTGNGIAVDGSGSAYVVGTASSSPAQGFPATPGSPLAYQGGSDAFVAKVAPDGTRLVYCSYVGGSNQDSGTSISVDPSGSAYITGATSSTPAQGFPVTAGPSLVFASNAGSEAFVAKLRPDGAGLTYCGYIGGSGGGTFLPSSTSGAGIAVDAAGSAYVAGTTDSPPAKGFPVTVGPALAMDGSPSAFIAKLKPDGTSLVYCGYAGGVNISRSSAGGVAVDHTGSAYLVGSVSRGFGGGGKAFVAKVKPDGSDVLYQPNIGATSDFGPATSGLGIALDPNGGVYVTGSTSAKPQDGFPVKVGPSLTQLGNNDAFIAKLHPDGNSLDYCGYIGGSNADSGNGIAVDGSGNAYVTGQTASSVADGFPASGGPSLTYGGNGDGFVARVKADGSGLEYCGYIGGSGGGGFFSTGEAGFGIAVDSAGDAYVAGEAASKPADGFPVTVGPSLVFGGGGTFVSSTDAFVAKITTTAGQPPPVISSILAVSTINGTGATVTWTTDVPSSSTVRYGKTNAYGSTTTGAADVTSHTVTLTGLTPSTLYHFQVVSISSGGSAPGSQTASTDQTFTTRAGGTGPAPVISAIAVSSITATGATITWTTDVNASSAVDYGTTTSYGLAATGAAAIQHTVVLTGLTASTTYHFRVRSATDTSPDAVSTDRTFTTTGAAGTPVISGITVTGIAANSATVTWNTDVDATSSVDYGTTTGYGATTAGASGTHHSIGLTGLLANTTYHFHVRSTAISGGAEAVSTDRTFTTTAVGGGTPVISNISIVNISASAATVVWDTDVSASSSVDYGKTTGYGSTTTGTAGTHHSVTLSGLTASTTYHFRVRSATATSPDAVSTDRTFTTSAPSPPVISAISVATNGTSATITWTTSVSADSTVRYGKTSAYGSTATGPANATAHSVTLTGLTAGTLYHFQVVSTATNGSPSGSQAASADQTFTLLGAVTGLRATAASSVEIDLSWSPLTGAEGYAIERRSGSSGFVQIGTTAAGTTTFASTGLTAATSYTYRVRASNATGAGPYSAEVSATTGQPPTGKLKVAAQVSFGVASVGATVRKTLVVSNASRTADLQVTIGGLTGAYTVVSGGGTALLKPGTSVNVTLQFHPAQRGTIRGTLNLTSSDPAKPTAKVGLTGRGK